MGTSTFLAWSLLAGGVLALLYFVLERYARKTEARVTGLPKRMITAFGLVFYGAILASEGIHLFSDMQPPAWTKLLSNAFPLVLGLFFLITAEDGEAGRSTRIFGGIFVALGAVIFVTESYHYAISLGTAASVSV